MVTILAEKPDVGNKIAAALDKIYLNNGKTVEFSSLKANEKIVKSQQNRDGYLKFNSKGHECCVTWGFGHLCSLKQAQDYNVNYKNWRMIPLPQWHCARSCIHCSVWYTFCSSAALCNKHPIDS